MIFIKQQSKTQCADMHYACVDNFHHIVKQKYWLQVMENNKTINVLGMVMDSPGISWLS